MAKEIDHDAMSSTATVVGDSIKGALKGVGVMALAGAVILGVPALLISVPFAAGAAAVGGVIGAVGGGAIGATVGSVLGLGGGASKVRKEQKAFDKQMQRQQENIGATIQQVQQQAYMAGAQDGQAQVIQKLQEVQAAQEQQTNFAAKLADKKGAVTPEAITQQREAAKVAPQQLGA